MMMVLMVLLCYLLFFAVVYPDFVEAKVKLKYGQYDALFVTRCEAACWKTNNKKTCMKICLSEKIEKPGICANSDLFAPVCLETCQHDSQCPEIKKCCRNECRKTCQNPVEINQALGVPDIPSELTILEGRRKRTVYVEWKPGLNFYVNEEPVLYLIEERHHSGRHFNEIRLSEWTVCARTSKSSLILRNLVKPGKWYQFRIAAVNENGTKGFTEKSHTYSISISPKPPKAPNNVTVGPFWFSNGSLNAELQWAPPVSDLPIQKYKVFWSRRLHEGTALDSVLVNQQTVSRWAPPVSDLPIQKYKVFWSRRLHGGTALDSVLVNQQTVSRDSTKFLLHNLQVNSLYFIQVQALVQYAGKERIKGEKSGLVLNTTNYTNFTDRRFTGESDNTTKNNNNNRIENFHLQKLFWSQQRDLRARIVWKAATHYQKEPIRYTVSWWSGPCYHKLNGYNHFKLAATTKASHFDLYDLQFSCRYRVSVREVSREGMKSIQDTSITFTTPSCSDFKNSTNKKTKCPKGKQQKQLRNQA